MKNIFRSIGSHLFVLLFSVTLVLSVSISMAMGAVYDDFNGSEINSTLWDIYNSDGILSQSGGLLHADGPPNLTYAHLRSRSIFRGDVEFVLDWRDFYATATVFTENCPQIWLQIDDHPEENNIIIFRGLCQDGHTFFSSGLIGGVWVGGFSAPALSQSGLLKISRVGSTITTSYNEGMGWVPLGTMGWVPLGTFPGAFTGDVIVQIAVYTGDNGTFHVSSDWVTYEGQVVFPLPDIKANGSDGPVSIPEGDPISVTIELDPGIYPGVQADWWCVADAPFGWYYYNDTGTWLPGFEVSYQGPLFTLTPPLEVLSMSGLPIGGYAFYFGVDGNRNGNLDEPLYYDSVEVNITPP
jgi:hypothetical protein